MDGMDRSREFAPGPKLGRYEITHAVWQSFGWRGLLGSPALETFGKKRSTNPPHSRPRAACI